MKLQRDYVSRSEPEQEIIDLIGLEATLNLEQSFGGRFLYVGTHGNPAIAEVIGIDAEQQLRAWFAPGDIYVPLIALKEHRNHMIHQDKNAGKTVHEIAAKVGLSRKRIEQILKTRYAKQQ